jgi:electron transport complex protein RnfG
MKGILKTSLVLFLIASVSVTIITLVYYVTYQPIQEQRLAAQLRVRQELFPDAEQFVPIEGELTGSMTSIVSANRADGTLIGYLVELAPEGYSGQVHMIVGIDEDKRQITGMRITRHTETPGLGALATKPRFFERFTGKSLVPLRVVKVGSGAPDEIDSITASTITSTAVTGAVNEAIAWYTNRIGVDS